MKLRATPPEPGGHVFLEVYALFVAGFLVMTVGTTYLMTQNQIVAGLTSLGVQWLLILVPLWPLVRGMRPSEYRNAIGLHRGEGIFKEIFAGFTAYLAAIPLFVVGVVITLVLVLVSEMVRTMRGAPPPEPPSNPIIDLLSQADIVTLFLIVSLATIWAPITEELVFRGALFRHMRGRLAWPLAAIGTALLFAFMHSYGPLMVSPLIMLGFMFAFMRQWRGSIIAPITAHFIHNATLMVVMISMIRLLSD